jgi:hypothetical protein
MITAFMKRFDMGPFLAAREKYESRVEEARAKNPERRTQSEEPRGEYGSSQR